MKKRVRVPQPGLSPAPAHSAEVCVEVGGEQVTAQEQPLLCASGRREEGWLHCQRAEGQGTREGMERSLKPRRRSQGRRAGDAGGRGQEPEAKEREWVPEPSK